MKHAINSIFNLKRIPLAFMYAFCGLKTLLRDEVAFKQEFALTIFILPAAIYLGTSPLNKAMLITSWLLVLIVEIINSAIEAVVDRISPDLHPLSKKIKDMSAAAVLLAIVNTVAVWWIILSGG